MIAWSSIIAVVMGIVFIYCLRKISDYGNPFIAGFMSVLWFFLSNHFLRDLGRNILVVIKLTT